MLTTNLHISRNRENDGRIDRRSPTPWSAYGDRLHVPKSDDWRRGVVLLVMEKSRNGRGISEGIERGV